MQLGKKSNQSLKELVNDVNAKVPLFGYPMIQYSSGNSKNNVSLTDSAGWRIAIATDGTAIKDLNQEDFKMLSTA